MRVTGTIYIANKCLLENSELENYTETCMNEFI